MTKKKLLLHLILPILISGCNYLENKKIEINGIEKIQYSKKHNLSECNLVSNSITKGKIIKINLYNSDDLNLSYNVNKKSYILSGRIDYEIQPNTLYGPYDAPKKFWQSKRYGELEFNCLNN